MKLHPWEPDLRTLVERIDQGDIDLQPDFQRQEVWPNAKKKRLIDTVLREWSIPPIHLVVVDDNRLEVLDGQQRLAAVRDFIHNRFTIDGNITPLDARVSTLHGMFYSRLSVAAKRTIDQYTLRCFRITDYSPEEPSELFYRLNQPTMLTAGEQRNALFGPAREQLKGLVNFFETEGNDKSTIGFSNARLAYDDILARLLFFIEAQSFGEKSTEARISERFRKSVPFGGSIIGRCEDGIRHFSRCREDASPFRFNKASILSWLLFFSRFDSAAPVGNLVQDFININSVRTNFDLSPAVELFNDRASLRVTDVSSVVYRDFVLCYLYTFGTTGTIAPPKIPVDLLQRVQAASQKPDATFEYSVSTLVDVESWSRTI